VAVVENVPFGRDHRLRKQVGALLSQGIDVTVVTPADQGNARVPGARVLEYRPAPPLPPPWGFLLEYAYAWIASAWLVGRAGLGRRIDAFHLCGSPDIFFTLAAPFRLLGAKVVFDQRDLWPEAYVTRYGRRSGAAYRALLLLERLSYRSADAVLVVNESLRQVAMERGGLPAGGVTVVGNGPVLARTAELESTAAREGTHTCVWVGLMGPQDRLDLAVAAVAFIVGDLGRRDCHFMFIGDGEVRNATERLVRDVGVAEWVTFTGWLDETDVFAHLRAASVGLEPNMEDFVSPVKVMEYMACGVPTVAFDLPETRRLAEDAASYAVPGDATDLARRVVALLEDADARRRMGESGRRRVRDSIAWEHQERRYVEVYRRLLRLPAGGAPGE
jgi:glycosyltransferase involved in cell wall biosynthesis